ncbi:hypothetical protein CEXT_462421 [Caerostris extrusa]|uniref:Uncharacterized protein n=1 Tax=Caerostris extrusa TaxID=172846 RepID=A0AAV4WMU8_CAEEX|nr:hypothetical protein CEXT_462421 [Caerostris extrusa]
MPQTNAESQSRQIALIYGSRNATFNRYLDTLRTYSFQLLRIGLSQILHLRNQFCFYQTDLFPKNLGHFEVSSAQLIPSRLCEEEGHPTSTLHSSWVSEGAKVIPLFILPLREFRFGVLEELAKEEENSSIRRRREVWDGESSRRKKERIIHRRQESSAYLLIRNKNIKGRSPKRSQSEKAQEPSANQ